MEDSCVEVDVDAADTGEGELDLDVSNYGESDCS